MPPRRLNLPDSTRAPQPGDDGRLFAPSAARNAAPILTALHAMIPAHGRALEIASGTGEHIVRFGAEFPDMSWQPSDIDAARLTSIDAWAADAAQSNIRPALRLNATAPGWSVSHNAYDLIIVSNLLHLISWPETQVLLDETALALAPGGICLIYGPFLRGAKFASDGDARFHASLIAQDPDIGYKSHQSVQDFQRDRTLHVLSELAMPANNLILAAHKPG
jgi:SAM-dependent methyltransferase